MNWISKLLANTVAVLATAYLLPGVFVDSLWTAVVVAIVLALLNTIVKPFLIIITIPATILSLGLFLFVINAVIILLANNLVDGFTVNSFWWALLFSLVMSLINSLLSKEDKAESKNKK